MKSIVLKAPLGAAMAFAPALTFSTAARASEGLPIAFVQTPKTVSRPGGSGIGQSIVAGRYVPGMRVATARFDNVANTVRVVTERFLCATDPGFNHDGTRLVFAGQRTPGDRLQIWELVGEDPLPRPIVTCNADCTSPVYMPDRSIVFASLLSDEYEEHGGQPSLSLYSLQPGSDTPVRLTFNPSSDFEPVVLPDGRILYSAWQHVGNHHWPRGTMTLMLINSDGTNVFPLTGNHRGPWLKRGSKPWIRDRVVFIQSDAFAEFGAGELVATSLNDAFAPYETLVPVDKFEVSGVALLPDGKLLLSARPTNGARTTFGLYVYNNGEITLLYDDPTSHELTPAVGGPSARPELRISTVVPDTPFGYVAILNCYESDRKGQHQLRRGSVAAVRVIQGRPLRPGGRQPAEFCSAPGREAEPQISAASATGYIPSRILGEVPPAADGSVYLKVPADRPLRFQLIDRDGFAIVNERAWSWVRPNERRVCIGCHENRELAPPNVAPLAARRAPTDLTDPAQWRTVTFRKDIQPIVRATCAVSGCHLPPTPTAGMNLSSVRHGSDRDPLLADRFGPAYANLLARQENKPFAIGGRRVHPGDARSSPLLWMLYGRALAAQYAPAPFERPMIEAHPGPMLPESQLELFRKWVDLGAAYGDSTSFHDQHYTGPPVTMEGQLESK